MTVYIAADHSGIELKDNLKKLLPDVAFVDLGGDGTNDNDDYPDVIAPCAERVAVEGAFGIVIGGSGQGEAMVANRTRGARAAVFYGLATPTEAIEVEGTTDTDPFAIVRLARRHNNANMLSLGARFLDAQTAAAAVRIFLDTPFSGDERHARRIAKF